eukprot:6177899-Pleurochrysis_carterae.AAC.2
MGAALGCKRVEALPEVSEPTVPPNISAFWRNLNAQECQLTLPSRTHSTTVAIVPKGALGSGLRGSRDRRRRPLRIGALCRGQESDDCSSARQSVASNVSVDKVQRRQVVAEQMRFSLEILYSVPSRRRIRHCRCALYFAFGRMRALG